MTTYENVPAVPDPAAKQRTPVRRGLHYLVSCMLEGALLSAAVNLLYAIGWSSVLSLFKIHGAVKMGVIGGATLASSVVMWMMFFITLLPTLWMVWRSWQARFWHALLWLGGVAVALAGIFSGLTDWVLVHAGARIISWALGWLPQRYTGKVITVERVLAHGVSVTVFVGLGLALLLVLLVQWTVVRLHRRYAAKRAAAPAISN